MSACEDMKLRSCFRSWILLQNFVDMIWFRMEVGEMPVIRSMPFCVVELLSERVDLRYWNWNLLSLPMMSLG